MFHASEMYQFIPFMILILFFALIIVVKDQKALLKIAQASLIVFCGGSLVLGCLAVFTGSYEAVGNGLSPGQFFIQTAVGLLCIAFGGVPLYVFFISKAVSVKRFEWRKKRYPGAPWKWVEQWAKRSVVYESNGPVGFVWFVLLTMITGFTFVIYVNKDGIVSKFQDRDVEYIAFFIVLSFILIPVFFYAASLLREHFKSGGNSIFEMSTYPGIVGGELKGTIRTPLKKIPKDGFRLALRCGLGKLTSQSGPNANRTVTLWEAEKNIGSDEATRGPRGVSFPVSFSIPADAQESDAWSPDKRITWTLTAFSSLEGASYYSRFDVPVFKAR